MRPGAVLLLQRVALIDRHELHAAERFLAKPQPERRLVGDHAGELIDLRHQALERHDPVHETHAIRLLRTDRRAGEEHAAEQPLWDVTRHVRGAAAAADI